jgi:hypothetical protein
MKRHMFGDDENTARANMLKINGCNGIEDVFSKADFAKFVLTNPGEYNESNSEFVKSHALSKPVLAYQFALRLEKDRLKLDDFDSDTKARIAKLVDGIAALLQSKLKPVKA